MKEMQIMTDIKQSYDTGGAGDGESQSSSRSASPERRQELYTYHHRFTSGNAPSDTVPSSHRGEELLGQYESPAMWQGGNSGGDGGGFTEPDPIASKTWESLQTTIQHIKDIYNNRHKKREKYANKLKRLDMSLKNLNSKISRMRYGNLTYDDDELLGLLENNLPKKVNDVFEDGIRICLQHLETRLK